MIDKPLIAQTSAQMTAVIRLNVPRDQMRAVMGPGLRELMAAVAQQGLTPSGAWFTHHFRMSPEAFDFEIGVPVGGMIAAIGRVTASRLPATTVAKTIYHGPYEGLPGAWGEFSEWISAQGLKTAPDLWECYVAGPESNADSSTWRTELCRPVVR